MAFQVYMLKTLKPLITIFKFVLNVNGKMALKNRKFMHWQLQLVIAMKVKNDELSIVKFSKITQILIASDTQAFCPQRLTSRHCQFHATSKLRPVILKIRSKDNKICPWAVLKKLLIDKVSSLGYHPGTSAS